MKPIYLVLLFFCSNMAYGQNSTRTKKIAKGNIYALIIGISDYQQDSITDLQYADDDALYFAHYLQSKAGGSVPPENIKILLDSTATIANIYDAKRKIENKVEKNDLVYFFFSGHGDVESDYYQLGFLLAYDTPSGNYLNNAVRIEDINIMANTMSIEREAKVIMITDACRSGRLSEGDNKLAFSTSDKEKNLMKKSEIRIASCQPDENSQEGTQWGGGRGAFSYHLINGLMGGADGAGTGVQDGKVEVNELSTYLMKVKEEVEDFIDEEQSPIVEGDIYLKLSYVDSVEYAAWVDSMKVLAVNGVMSSIARSKSVRSADDVYFNLLNREKLLSDLDFTTMASLDKVAIADKFISRYSYTDNNVLSSSSWPIDIRNDAVIRADYMHSIAAVLHNKIQQVINAYLKGDKEELQKREYSNVDQYNYDEYVDMISVAFKLVDSESQLKHMLEVKYNYFAGLVMRFQYFEVDNQDQVWDKAYKYQVKALELDERSAYVNNEIGVLHMLKDDDLNALVYFYKAVDIAPYWAIPKVNLSTIYFRNRLYKQSREIALEAVECQSDSDKSQLAVAYASLFTNDLRQAEISFEKTLELNPQNVFAYKGKGHLLCMFADYEEANKYYNISQDIIDDLFDGNHIKIRKHRNAMASKIVEIKLEESPQGWGASDKKDKGSWGSKKKQRTYNDDASDNSTKDWGDDKINDEGVNNLSYYDNPFLVIESLGKRYGDRITRAYEMNWHKAHLALYERDFDQANILFRELLNENLNNSHVLYTLSRINAQLSVLKDNDDYLILAATYRDMAMDSGFDFNEVLSNDPLLKPLRNYSY